MAQCHWYRSKRKIKPYVVEWDLVEATVRLEHVAWRMKLRLSEAAAKSLALSILVAF